MEQMDLFDLLNAQAPAETKAATVATKEVLSELPHVSPLDAARQPKLTLCWVSYALAKFTLNDRAIYALILPVKGDAVEVIRQIRESFKAAGIDPDIPWDEQGVSMFKTKKAYSKNQMVRYALGMAGDINGGYAVKPLCPICGRESSITDLLIGGQPYEPICGVETDCGHKSIAVMVFLPGYQYAQEVFEVIS